MTNKIGAKGLDDYHARFDKLLEIIEKKGIKKFSPAWVKEMDKNFKKTMRGNVLYGGWIRDRDAHK